MIDFTNTSLEEILEKIAELDESAYEDEKWGYKSPKFGIAFNSVNGEDIQYILIYSSKEYFQL